MGRAIESRHMESRSRACLARLLEQRAAAALRALPHGARPSPEVLADRLVAELGGAIELRPHEGEFRAHISSYLFGLLSRSDERRAG